MSKVWSGTKVKIATFYDAINYECINHERSGVKWRTYASNNIKNIFKTACIKLVYNAIKSDKVDSGNKMTNLT